MSFFSIREEANEYTITWLDENNVLGFDPSHQLFLELKEKLSSLPQNAKVKLQYHSNNCIDFDHIKEFYSFIREQKCNLSFDYQGQDEEVKKTIAECNGKLSANYQLSQGEWKYFSLVFDEQHNECLLSIKENKQLSFLPESEGFKELVSILSGLNPGGLLNISYQNEAVDFSNFHHLTTLLSEKRLPGQVKFTKQSTPDEDNKRNQLLADVYHYILRKKQIDPHAAGDINASFNSKPVTNRKIRRAKQLLNRKLRLPTHIQHQYHHHVEQQAQQEKHKQVKKQNKKEQLKLRISQIQHQQERMQAYGKGASLVNIKDLGQLIDENNLKLLVSDSVSLEEVKVIWNALVGEFAFSVENNFNRITHVPRKTMELIIQNKEQFRYGIHFDDLPNGFGFTVQELPQKKIEHLFSRKRIKHERDFKQSVLYFDENLLKPEETRQDSFLAPRIKKERAKIVLGTVGQFFPFFTKPEFTEENYEEFITQNTSYFNLVFHPATSSNLKERIAAFIHLITLDDPERVLDKESLALAFSDFSHENLNSLGCVLLEKGANAVIQLVEKFNQLKQASQYSRFKKLFMDTSSDWRSLVEASSRKHELNAFESMDYLCTMPIEERLWWDSLTEQHWEANHAADLIDLVNAHKYFFEQIKKIDPSLSLPFSCPLKNVHNLKLGYARLLYLLQKSLDPHEQAQHLEDLDFSMQGCILGVQNGPYFLVSKEMDLSPYSEITDWLKYEKYAPKIPEGFEACGQEERDYALPTRYGYSTPEYWKKARFSLLAFRFYEPRYSKQLIREGDKLFIKENYDPYGITDWTVTKSPLAVEDPELQDDLIMTEKESLSYEINISRLVELMKTLKGFSNLVKYFYRFIGTEKFTFPFKVYQNAVKVVHEANLHEEAETNLALKRRLIVLLALGSTGSRVLSQDRDLPVDMIYLLDKVGGDVAFLDEVIERIALLGDELRPSVVEITALLTLTHDINFLESILNAVSDYGESIYDGIIALSQCHENITQEEWLVLLRQLDPFKDKDPIVAQNLLLLSAIVKKEAWGMLSDSLSKIETLAPEISFQVNEMLNQIDFAHSSLISLDELTTLINELATLSPNDSALQEMVLGSMTACLPQVYFTTVGPSKRMVYLLRTMGKFAETIKGLAANLSDTLDALKATLQQELEANFLSFYADQCIAFAKNFISDFTGKVNNLAGLLEAMKKKESPEMVQEVLICIQSLLHCVEDPLKNFNLIHPDQTVLEKMNAAAATLAVKGVVNLAIAGIKQQVLEVISEHLLGALKLEITEGIMVLRIREEEEEDLAGQLAHCLLAKLPELPGKALALEVDHVFKCYEPIQNFLKILRQLSKNSTHDSMLALLYRQGYLASTSQLPLKELTEILGYFKGYSNLDLEETVSHILRAFEEGVDLQKLKSVIASLTHDTNLLSNDMFQKVFHLGCSIEMSVSKLLSLKTSLPDKAFAFCIDVASTFKDNPVAAIFLDNTGQLLKKQEPHLVADFLLHAFKRKEIGEELLKNIQELSVFLVGEQANVGASLLTIVKEAAWDREEEEEISLQRQLDLIKKLADGTAYPGVLEKLAQLYSHYPHPCFSALEKAVKEGTAENIIAWIDHYELDPFGKLDKVRPQLQTQGMDSFVHEIMDLVRNKKIDPGLQQELIDASTYIVAITDQYGLHINREIKPLSQFTRQEIQFYYQECIERVKNNPQDKAAQYEALAILCTVLFRTTGKFPYNSQIISALTSILLPGSMLQQIPTGQGKTISIALAAALSYSFSEKHITICSKNQLLTERDFKENLDFYRYLNIPVGLVTAATEENYYEERSIVYSTVSDKSLYDSRLKITNGFEIPPPEEQTLFCDEADSEFFDNKSAFNFSEGKEDPYVNPLEWLYPYANEYIERIEFTSEDIVEEEDIVLFRHFIKNKNPEQYQLFREKLTDFRLNQLLDAACCAKSLKEDIDFVVGEKRRLFHGEWQIISEAHLLVNHVEDKEVTLSYGVQQALHARLNKTYHEKIECYKQGAEGRPPFSCDNQIECVDSQHSHSFFKKFSRILAYTGSAFGSEEEKKELVHSLEIHTLLDIPPRRKSQLQYLAPIFCGEDSSFFFGPQTQLEAIISLLKKNRESPVLISCADIEKAEKMAAALAKHFPSAVQLIHAKKATDSAAFEALVKTAGESGKITVVTPLVGRGVDIKTGKLSEEEVNKLSEAEKQITALSEGLLVIETHLERRRTRKQLHGRSARNDKPGKTIGIFDVQELLHQHGYEMSKLNRKEKLQVLEKIMEEMDREASLERHIFLQVRGYIVGYEEVLDDWVKRSPGERDNILAAKVRFIEEAERLWTTLLEESDPFGEYANPYVRYNEQDELDEEVLSLLVTDFSEKIHEVFTSCCSGFLTEEVSDTVKNSYCYDPKAFVVEVEESKPEVKKTIAALPSLTKVYLKYNPKGMYAEVLSKKEEFDSSLAKWVENNPKADEALQKLMKEQEASIVFYLSPSDRDYHAVLLQSMTDSLNDSLTSETITSLLSFYSLTLHDGKSSISNPEAVHQAMLPLLEKLLDIGLIKFSEKDKDLIQGLKTKLLDYTKENRLPTLFDLNQVLRHMIHFTQNKLQDTTSKVYLEEVKQFLTAMTCKIAQKREVNTIARDTEFNFFCDAFNHFLETINKRLGAPAYQKHHPYALKKINNITEFWNEWKKKVEGDFLKENATMSLEELTRKAFEDKGLLDILGYNTVFGSQSNTEALREFAQFRKEFETAFGYVKQIKGSQKSVEEDYQDQLDGILKRLEARSKAGFFKDRDLYTKKIEKLSEYIKDITALIEYKKDNNMSSIDNEIRLTLERIKNDKDLCQSTSTLFFKSPHRVTVVKDIENLSQDFLNKLR